VLFAKDKEQYQRLLCFALDVVWLCALCPHATVIKNDTRRGADTPE